MNLNKPMWALCSGKFGCQCPQKRLKYEAEVKRRRKQDANRSEDRTA